jgi:hypothetical protein
VKQFCTFVVFLAAVATASATPIQPDIKKLLSTPRPTQQFAPARVGWNGPEAATASAEPSPFMQRFGPVGFQHDLRKSLIAVATPDWRIFLALGALILLLRALRSRSTLVPVPISYRRPVDAFEPDSKRPAA